MSIPEQHKNEEPKIFTLRAEPAKDEFLDNAFRTTMSELNEFYERQWTYGFPGVFIVRDRATMDIMYEGKTPLWVSIQ